MDRRQPNSLLDRADLEMLTNVSLWAEVKFGKVSRIRDLYSADHRPRVECEVLITLIRSVKNVKDFYTIPD
jgi:hypothetical protein